jgi:acyltransferase
MVYWTLSHCSSMQTRTAIQTTKRIHWIDICRGIGIILVLYGHLFVSDKNNYLIFAFHMPLFFFISGLVFKPTSKSLWETTKKYFRPLLVPYYVFAILTYLFTLISQTAGDVSIGGVAYQLFGMLYGSGSDGMLGYNVVLWFLPCLFITKLIFAAITKKVSQTKTILFVLAASAISGYLLSVYIPWLKLPFNAEIALTGITFFGAGYLLRTRKQLFHVFSKQKPLLALTAMLFTIVIATLHYHVTGNKVDLRANQLNNFFLFYLGAFGGIVGWMTISQIIAKNAILEYIGRHSIIIFAWHNVISKDLHNVVNSLLAQDLLNNIKYLLPTIYAFILTSIILFSRMVIIKLKGVYPLSFTKQ